MLRYVAGSEDKDFVDRLHSYFTCNILIGLSVLVSFKQFGGKPIECLVPDMFSSSWEQYAENYCWAQDNYYVPMNEIVAGMPESDRRQRRISYYQWVPFFLLVEAACFRFPSLLWQYLAGHSGIKVHEMIRLSSDPNNIKPDIKRANVKSLAKHLQGALRFHRRLHKKQIRPHSILWLFNLPYSASFVTLMYLCTKLFLLVNVCIQLLLLNKYLMLVFFTSASFLYWLFVTVLPQPNRRFINRHLEISELQFDPVERTQDIRRFIDYYLKCDGIFVIRMVTFQSGVIFGTDLILTLWKSFFGLDEQLKRSNSMPDVDKSPEYCDQIWPPSPDASDQRELCVSRRKEENTGIKERLMHNILSSNSRKRLD
ncbi:Innexin [Dictyocaulus viviparus]|uniref:Innexin n=1 Tax=Dictyocaulus viviparus TaxID=29172 RepID=A0A0D8Y6Y7_DICVI|nr:Innexin [Dictyocaulus viviparus]